jgi:hypothetical protein
MHLLRHRVLVVLFGTVCALGLAVHDAAAQSQSTMASPQRTDAPDPVDPGWHVDVAPYLWFPGINGTVGVLDHDSSVHVTARDVLSYFNFGLMGAVETRYNRIIIPVDFMWVRLKDAGGGGSGTRLDYQVVGLLGYKVKRLTLLGGWRYLVIHKTPNDHAFADLAMTGVVLGVVIPVK